MDGVKLFSFPSLVKRQWDSCRHTMSNWCWRSHAWRHWYLSLDNPPQFQLKTDNLLEAPDGWHGETLGLNFTWGGEVGMGKLKSCGVKIFPWYIVNPSLIDRLNARLKLRLVVLRLLSILGLWPCSFAAWCSRKLKLSTASVAPTVVPQPSPTHDVIVAVRTAKLLQLKIRRRSCSQYLIVTMPRTWDRVSALLRLGELRVAAPAGRWRCSSPWPSGCVSWSWACPFQIQIREWRIVGRIFDPCQPACAICLSS